MKNIGIFGGSFSPPHLGHKKLVENAIKELALDKVYVSVCYKNPLEDKTLAPYDDRLKWTRWTFQDMPNVIVYDCHYWYFLTLLFSVISKEEIELGNAFNQYFVLVGEDEYKALPKWKSERTIQKLATVIPYERPKGSFSSSYIRECLRGEHRDDNDGDHHLFKHMVEPRVFESLESTFGLDQAIALWYSGRHGRAQ